MTSRREEMEGRLMWLLVLEGSVITVVTSGGVPQDRSVKKQNSRLEATVDMTLQAPPSESSFQYLDPAS